MLHHHLTIALFWHGPVSPKPLLSPHSWRTKVDCVHLCLAGSDCLPLPYCSEGAWDFPFCPFDRQVSQSSFFIQWLSQEVSSPTLFSSHVLLQVSDFCHVCHHSHCYQSNSGAELLTAQPEHSHHVPQRQACKLCEIETKLPDQELLFWEQKQVVLSVWCSCFWKWCLASWACPHWWMTVRWRLRWTVWGSGGAAHSASCREQRNTCWNSLAAKCCSTSREKDMDSIDRLVRLILKFDTNSSRA